MPWNDLQDSVMRAAQAEPQPRSKIGAIWALLWLAALAGVVVAAIAIPGVSFFAVTASQATGDVKNLPLELKETPNPQTTQVLASNGQRIAYFYQENRQDVKLADISLNMQNAIVAIEDYRFYEHGALDLKGTLRALVNNSSSGSTQGGSTLTQQLVKLTLVQQATTKEQREAATQTEGVNGKARKIRELKLAINYEEKYSKKQILEKYLNIAYFGDGAYGIWAAAKHYFSVTPDQLSVQQAATLAGLVKNPVQYDPTRYPALALQRRNVVLGAMATHGKITQADADTLSKNDLGLVVYAFPNGCVSSIAEFSCSYIQNYLLQEPALGATFADRKRLLETGGLTIKSNIDLRIQKAANRAVKDNVYAKDSALGALAMIEPGSGKVRGLAQSRPMGSDTKKGQTYINFTVPTQYGNAAGFQPGSTFKLFTLAAALKKGMPVSTSYNSPQQIDMPPGTYWTCSGDGTGDWDPENSTGAGTFNMYGGFAKSVNTYFAQLERDAGLCNTVKAAMSMGISQAKKFQVPSFTLGVADVSPLQLAAAYATVASGGVYCEPQPVAEVLDNTGKVLKKYDPACKRVLDKGIAAQINDIAEQLQQPGGFGYQAGTGLKIPSAGKTGTTSFNKAVWYMGYTPELATASVVAGINGKGRPVTLVGKTVKGRALSSAEAHGSTLAGPMWAEAMQTIQNFLAPTPFDAPPQARPANPAPAEKKSDDSGKKKSDDQKGKKKGNGGGKKKQG